jgi:hypothetical protein
VNAVSTESGWQAYALAGRPDFLNYLHAGDVSWGELWEFYRESDAPAEAILRVMGLFHIFLSQQYDNEGSVLDRDSGAYPLLREWAHATLELGPAVPEDRVRDSLASLLGQSLISALYYEAAFSVFLEATLERHAEMWAAAARLETQPLREGAAETGERRLSVRLSDLPGRPAAVPPEEWDASVARLLSRHYASWNEAYSLALGDEDAAWIDEGGSD